MKQVYFLLILLLIGFITNAQESTFAEPVETKKTKDLPVREPFLGGVIIDNQTTFIPVEKTFEFVIQHKFGGIDNGISDIFGLYAAGSYIRLAGNYVPTKNLQLSYGLNRLRMYNDFSVKYTLLEQTRKNRIPVAVGLYTNMAIDGRKKAAFGKNYNLGSRFSYFSQLIIGRKFGEIASIQANVSFAHYNMIDSGIDHDKLSVGINGRIPINYKASIIFQYDMPLQLKEITEHREFINPSKPNLGLGWEVRTSAHVFQLYMATTEGLIPQHNAMFNYNDWLKGQIRFGFTITRFYNFS